MTEKNKKYNKIVKKVKGLLAISKDQRNDEESQSAFLLAQKLMLEYQINKNDVEDFDIDQDQINTESVTIFKKLFWWERKLGAIIAKNFRLKMFYQGKYGKNKITFYGFGKDLELGKEMYILAYEVLLFHSKEFINNYYKNSNQKRTRYFTESIKSSYIRGFLLGLEKRFSEQVAELKEQYEVMVLIPEEVEKSYKEYSQGFGSYTIEQPPVEVTEAYRKGFETGSEIDFTKSTVSTDYSSLIGKIIEFNEGITRGLLAKVIRIEGKTMHLLIMNSVSSGSSLRNPSFYSWTLSVTHDFSFADSEKQSWLKAYLEKDLAFFKKNVFDDYPIEELNRFYNQIAKALKEAV